MREKRERNPDEEEKRCAVHNQKHPNGAQRDHPKVQRPGGDKSKRAPLRKEKKK